VCLTVEATCRTLVFFVSNPARTVYGVVTLVYQFSVVFYCLGLLIMSVMGSCLRRGLSHFFKNSPSIVTCLASQLILIDVTEASNSTWPNSNVPVLSIMSITSVSILGCVLVVGVTSMGLRRYRQFVRANIGSAEANSFVEGSTSGVAMSISGSDTGDLDDGSGIGVAMSISGSDTGDLEVSSSNEVSLSGTEIDDPGVTTFREELDITVSVEIETKDCHQPNAETDFRHTTLLQIDEEAGRAVKVTQITKDTGSGRVNDTTGETTPPVDRDVEYRRATGLKLLLVAKRFIQKNLSRLSKNSDSAVMTPEFTEQGEELSSVSPPFVPTGGLAAVLMMVGTYPVSSPNLWACPTVARMLRQLHMDRDYKLMIVDLFTCAHPHRSGLFDFVTDIAYSVEVTEWFKFRIEEAVGRISREGHLPVLYVVHQDWVIFSRIFDLTPEIGMPPGSVFRTKISGVSVLCIHGIHLSPINFGTHFRQYVFDMSVCRACLMCPDNPVSAWNLILDEDAKNVLAMGEFLTKHLVSITDLKSVRASCLHRNLHFVQLHFAAIVDLGDQLLSEPGTVIPAINVALLVLQCDDYDDVSEMFTRIGKIMFSARSVQTCDMFISLASCLVRHANATSVLLGTPSCVKFCEEQNMRASLEHVLPVIGITGSQQIIRFLSCTTLVFQYIMVQGHSGKVTIETFEKVGISVENVPMFLCHCSNLVFEYVTNRPQEVLDLQKKMRMSQGQMVKILTFGTDSTFRYMLLLTAEQVRNCSSVWAFLSAPQPFAEAMRTVENTLASAHGFQESSLIGLLTHGTALGGAVTAYEPREDRNSHGNL